MLVKVPKMPPKWVPKLHFRWGHNRPTTPRGDNILSYWLTKRQQSGKSLNIKDAGADETQEADGGEGRGGGDDGGGLSVAYNRPRV
jgi:hypothetical protein